MKKQASHQGLVEMLTAQVLFFGHKQFLVSPA
jgi:hypothetical protein